MEEIGIPLKELRELFDVFHFPIWTHIWLNGFIIIAGILFVAYEKISVERRFNLTLGSDLILKLQDRFDSAETRHLRYKAANFLSKMIDNKDDCKDDVDGATALIDLLNFFEMIGILLHRHALDVEIVWNVFSPWIYSYWFSSTEDVENKRHIDPEALENLTLMFEKLIKIERMRSPDSPWLSIYEIYSYEKNIKNLEEGLYKDRLLKIVENNLENLQYPFSISKSKLETRHDFVIRLKKNFLRHFLKKEIEGEEIYLRRLASQEFIQKTVTSKISGTKGKLELVSEMVKYAEENLPKSAPDEELSDS